MIVHVEIRLDKWYWVIGQGPMQLIKVYSTGNLAMRSLGDCNYSAGPDQLRELTVEGWATYKRDSRARGFTVPDELPTDRPTWADDV